MFFKFPDDADDRRKLGIKRNAVAQGLNRKVYLIQICPGLTTNEIQIPYDKHHKVSSLVKSHQNTHNSVKYEVI